MAALVNMFVVARQCRDYIIAVISYAASVGNNGLVSKLLCDMCRAELTNGRAAMVGFLCILALEYKAGVPFF